MIDQGDAKNNGDDVLADGGTPEQHLELAGEERAMERAHALNLLGTVLTVFRIGVDKTMLQMSAEVKADVAVMFAWENGIGTPGAIIRPAQAYRWAMCTVPTEAGRLASAVEGIWRGDYMAAMAEISGIMGDSNTADQVAKTAAARPGKERLDS